MKAQRDSVVKLHSFFGLGAGWQWEVNTMPWSLYPREKDSVPTEKETGWASGPV